MIRSHLFNILLLTSIAFLTSCKKKTDSNDPTAPNIPDGSVMQFFENELANEMQTFTIDPSIHNVLNGKKGTVLSIPPNSFKDASNNLVTGNVEIKLAELLDARDALLSNKPTVSNGNLLSSGGQIFVSATQNGQQLSRVSNSQPTAYLPTSSPDASMSRFVGNQQDGGAINWLPANTAGLSNQVTIVQDSIEDYYWMDVLDSTYNWINCDRFMNASGTTVRISLPSGYATENALVFAYIKSENSLSGAYYSYQTGEFQAPLPLGQQVTIVALGNKSGQYYSTFHTTTVQVGMHPQLIMNSTTESAFRSAVKSL